MLALVLMAGGFSGLILGYSKYSRNSELNGIAMSEIAGMEAEVKRLNGEGDKVQQQLSPEQKNLLIAAHKLVANKSFGWSRLFADLESVLPGSVSASRINVQNVYQDGGRVKAELEFAVLSRDYAAVMSMIDKMNNSGLFQAELRAQDLQKNDRFTYSEYTLRLIYTPFYGSSPSAPDDVARNSSGGDQQ